MYYINNLISNLFYLNNLNMENKKDISILTDHFNIDNMKAIKDINEILNMFNTIENVYFTNYKTERDELLKKEIMSLLKLLDLNLQNSSQLSKDEISFLYFVKSLSLDKLPEYSKESEESASKSVYYIILYIIILYIIA